MKKERTRWKISDILALPVFAVFAMCVLAVLLTGARVYRNLTEIGNALYDSRTAVRYVTTRLHQSGSEITVEQFGSCQALAFREEIGGDVYLTRIYCHEGFLRELFAAGDSELSPEDGEKVLEMEAVSFAWNENMLTIDMTWADGTSQQIVFYGRGNREVAP